MDAKQAPAPPCTLVIFGAAGDLTMRLLMPALYNLAGSGLLDKNLKIIGADHNTRDAKGWGKELGAALQSFTKDPNAEFHPKRIDPKTWDFIAKRLDYIVFDFDNAADFQKLKATLAENGGGNVIFYLAVSARFFGPITTHLSEAGLLNESNGAYRRVIIEKPFGSDLPSAKKLNATLLRAASESQFYRIDHFLGKEPVQGISALRFGNGFLEPLLRREHVDSVQITAAETIGIGTRGAFYDATGALRDMVPNHLFSLLTTVAMDAPGSFTAESIRNEKAKLLQALRPVAPAQAVRGQYAGYHQEDNVKRGTKTETYAAIKVHVDNARWDGVPFYIRTGKFLANHLTSIAITLRSAPARALIGTHRDEHAPSIITLKIAPSPGIVTTFNAKMPGTAMQLGRVESDFLYQDVFDEKPTVGYETLLYAVMNGDAQLFQRDDMVDASWAALQPTLEAWADSGAGVQRYAKGGNGPALADDLLAKDNRRWFPLSS